MKFKIEIGTALSIAMALCFSPDNMSVASAQPNVPKANAAIAVGDDPRSGAVGDFNGDGNVDIATANQETNNVSILLSDDLAHFQQAAKSPIKVGALPRSLTIGDFNSDKKLDLAVSNSGSNTISILLGEGNGQFVASEVPIKTDSRPLCVITTDFDNNATADLAVVNNGADSVSVLLGDGKGAFVEAAGSPLKVGKTPFYLTTNDLNADGVADMLVANSGSNSVSVLMGQGGGSFSDKTDFPTEVSPRCISIADFNGDGKSDLVVANTGANSVSFLPGLGNGKFADRTDFAVGPTPRSVVTSDFNNDGKLDLAVTCFGANKIFLLYGDGAGDFNLMPNVAHAVGSEPSWSVLTDLNHDKKADLVVINSDSNDVSLLIGNGVSGFKP